MLIYKTSWHYRYLSWMNKKGFVGIHPENYKNLCPYFWIVIFSILLFPILFIMKGVVSFFEGWGNRVDTGLYFDYLHNRHSGETWAWWEHIKNYSTLICIGVCFGTLMGFMGAILIIDIWLTLTVIGIFVAAVTIVIIMIAGIITIYDFFDNGSPGLIRSFLKVKKEKVCPYLDFVED